MFGKKWTTQIPPNGEKTWKMVIYHGSCCNKITLNNSQKKQHLVKRCCTSPWSLSSHGCPDFGPFAILPENIQVIQVAQDSEYQNMVEPSSKTHLQGINTCKNIGGVSYQPQVLYTNKKALPTHHPTNYVVISKRKTTQLKSSQNLLASNLGFIEKRLLHSDVL